MNNSDQQLDQWLQEQTERCLKQVDWDQFHSKTMNRLDNTKSTQVWKRWIGIAACAAVVLMAFFLGPNRTPPSPSLLDQIQSGQLSTGSISVSRDILLSSDPQTILLAENVHTLQNDPLLQPISIWDQSQGIRFKSHE